MSSCVCILKNDVSDEIYTNKLIRMKRIIYLFSLLFLISCEDKPKVNPPHIVFVTGDEEYRSEESMPMLASILKRELNADVSICYSLDSLGFNFNACIMRPR